MTEGLNRCRQLYIELRLFETLIIECDLDNLRAGELTRVLDFVHDLAQADT